MEERKEHNKQCGEENTPKELYIVMKESGNKTYNQYNSRKETEAYIKKSERRTGGNPLFSIINVLIDEDGWKDKIQFTKLYYSKHHGWREGDSLYLDKKRFELIKKFLEISHFL